MTRTALVTGATGLLGRAVLNTFSRASGWTAVGTGLTRAEPPQYRKLDLLDEKAVEACLAEVNSKSGAANRSPDSCASSPSLARALNATSTLHLSTLCSRFSILLICISTDYVFPGPPGAAPYTSSSAPSPTNIYGETKLEGEQAVLSTTNGGVVLRVPVLYGRCEPKDNWKESAVNCLVDAVYKAQEPSSKASPVKMDDWAQRYPTATADVGRVCRDVAEKYLSSTAASAEEMPRILQFSAEEQMTKYRMCEVLAEILGLPLEGGMVANKEGNDPRAEVQRPYDTHLSTRELKGIGVDVSCMPFKDWWRRELGAYRK
ncbi:MAG: hypothetical protein Q9160_002681 [Pyrenula sp. 1 TL-2023]